MLFLTRKIGESVVINDNIEVTIVEVRGRSIKLGFDFPPDVTVLRRELFDKIQDENREAAGAAVDLLASSDDAVD
jgi:carbon storage regulator